MNLRVFRTLLKTRALRCCARERLGVARNNAGPSGAGRPLLVKLRAGLLVCLADACLAERNVAPLSDVTSSPYVGAAIAYLTDGRLASPHDNTLMLGAPLPIRSGQEMPVQYEFRLPHRVRVTGVRLYQHETYGRRPASGYVIELDTDDDGSYDWTLVNEVGGRGGAWFAYAASPPQFAHRLRFRTTRFAAGAGPNYGAAAVGEFEILTDSKLLVRSPPVLVDAPRAVEDTARATVIGTALSAAQEEEVSEPFRRGLFGSMWLFWSAGKDYSEQQNAAKVALLDRLKINRYWLYPGVDVPNDPRLPYLTLREARTTVASCNASSTRERSRSGLCRSLAGWLPAIPRTYSAGS